MKKNAMLNRIGWSMIILGLLLNVWFLDIFSGDGLVSTSKIMIWCFDLFFIGAGFMIIKYKDKIKGKEILFSLILFVLFFTVLEICFKVYFNANMPATSMVSILDERLGWKNVPNKKYELSIKGFEKSTVSLYRNGFREYGDPHTNKKKVFVIGDSYTLALMVSNGKCYYNYLPPEYEIFTFGCGGYGTLQQYMVLDEYLDSIKPDLVIWQFCSNDIINNDVWLESRSFRNNNHMKRPYLVDQKIVIKQPSQTLGWLYELLDKSYLLKFLNLNLHIVLAETIGSIEDDLSIDNPHFKNAANTTSRILQHVKQRVGTIPIIAFCTDRPAWIGHTFEEISKTNNIQYIDSIPEIIANEKKKNVKVDGEPYDSHWNSKGHEIVGKHIAFLLKGQTK